MKENINFPTYMYIPSMLQINTELYIRGVQFLNLAQNKINTKT